MIRIGILGYGNIGRGVEAAISQNADMKLVAVFTRRDPTSVKIATPDAVVCGADSVIRYATDIDVLMLCGGSATDLPVQTPEYARHFNVVDSFDTHRNIPDHYAAADAAAVKGGKVALISAGWDPGLFSINRAYANAILPDGCDYTFWGRGVSQGHSDAVRRIEGVADARQYTVPVDAALEAVRSGDCPKLTVRDRHKRICYVVAEAGADRERIEREIVTMKNYFDEYDTTVHFITADEMSRDHSTLPHGGFVIRTGRTGDGTRQTVEYKLTLESNPAFTGNILAAYARAIARMSSEGRVGAITVLDIPPAYLSPLSGEELRRTML